MQHQHYRKSDYLTAVYSAVPFHASEIRNNGLRVADQRRDLARLTCDARKSISRARWCENQINYDNSLASYRSTRSRHEKDRAACENTAKAIKLMNQAYSGLRTRRNEEKRTTAECDTRIRQRLNKSSARSREALTAIRKQF